MKQTNGKRCIQSAGCSRWNDQSNHNDVILMPPPAANWGVPKLSTFLAETVQWHRMPGEVLITIFRSLSDRDRCQASQVCKSWNNIFSLASLWRKRIFGFRDSQAIETQERYSKFLDQLGHHVRDVTLEFGRPNASTVIPIVIAFEAFVRKVNKCPTLRFESIKVSNLNFQSGWRFFSLHRGKVIRVLSSLLKKQPFLTSVDLSFCQMDRDEGTRVLESLVCDSKFRPRKDISRLDIEGFFAPPARVLRHVKFSGVMGGFSALSFICFDEHYVSEVILEKLTTSSASTLRIMEMVVDADNIFLEQTVSSDAWSAVVERCPLLKVTVRFVGLCTYRKYAAILQRNMPLSAIWVTWLGLQEEKDTALLLDIEQLMKRLTELFHKTLMTLMISLFPEATVSLDKALIDLIQKCLSMREIRVTAAIQPETLYQIVAIVTSKPRNELRFMELVVPGFTKDMQGPDFWKKWPNITTLRV